jgi:large subunit ribosomal protein L10
VSLCDSSVRLRRSFFVGRKSSTPHYYDKDHPALVIKGGYFEGQPLEAADVVAFANLESREVLLGKLAGAFKASLFAAAYMFTAPQSSAVRAIDQLRQKKETQDA